MEFSGLMAFGAMPWPYGVRAVPACSAHLLLRELLRSNKSCEFKQLQIYTTLSL